MKPKSVINDSNSAPQVPFTTMLALLCMWFGISMPLVYLGYYFGFRKQPYDNPVRTNQIPRQVPEQRWYMNKFVGWVGHAPLHHCHGESRALWSPLGSSPPESSWLGSYRSAPCSLSCSSSSAWVKPAAVGSEPDRLWWPLRLCLHTQAIWENQFYYLFGFLFLVFIILVVSCSQISIVMVYFQLCAEVNLTGNYSSLFCCYFSSFALNNV